MIPTVPATILGAARLPVGARRRDRERPTLTVLTADSGSSAVRTASGVELALQRRLRVLAVIVAAALVAESIRTLVWSSDAIELWPRADRHAAPMWLGMAAVYAVVAIGLTWRRACRLSALRVLELGMVFLPIVLVAIDLVPHYRGLAARHAIARIDLQTRALALPLFALIVGYGMFIPNSLRRAMAVVGAMAVSPLVLLAVLRRLDPPAFQTVLTASAPALTSLGVAVGVGVAMSIACTRMVHSMRAEALQARQLGQYRLTERVASGGAGEVWRAEHRFLARPAAIKVVRPSADGGEPDDAILRRFEREAEITASLSSPHTVELYDFGISQAGELYYVMELLAGIDLSQFVQRWGPIDSARTVAWLSQVCDSIAEAHDHDLIHGDIKPANIIVCRLGRRPDFIKVFDFGMARPAQPADGRSDGDTDRHITGTPAFIAPEQVEGTSIDRRADIYALGCVAYWLLTGRLVFECDSTIDVLVAHSRQAPVPPSQRTRKAIAPDLEALVMACLHKRPEDRPQTADELSRRLQACRVGPDWSDTRAEQWWRDHAESPASPGRRPGALRG